MIRVYNQLLNFCWTILAFLSHISNLIPGAVSFDFPDRLGQAAQDERVLVSNLMSHVSHLIPGAVSFDFPDRSGQAAQDDRVPVSNLMSHI